MSTQISANDLNQLSVVKNYLQTHAWAPKLSDAFTISARRCFYVLVASVSVTLILTQVFFVVQFESPSPGAYPPLKQHNHELNSPRTHLLSKKHHRDFNEKWILTSSLARMEKNIRWRMDWTVLVYGEASMKCSYPTCLHLHELELLTYEKQEWRLHTDQLHAFLLAVKNGAKVIYSVKHFQSYKPLKSFLSGETTSAITMPLLPNVDHLAVDNRRTNTSMSFSWKSVKYDYVIMENVQPHLQAVVHCGRESEMSSSIHLPPFVLPVTPALSINFDDMLLSYESYWTFILKDIPYGDLITQTLLLKTGGSLVLHQTNQLCRHLGNSSENHKAVLDLLNHVQCPVIRSDVVSCLRYIIQLLYKNGFLDIKSVKRIAYWVKTLRKSEYRPPRISRISQPPFSHDDNTFGIISVQEAYKSTMMTKEKKPLRNKHGYSHQTLISETEESVSELTCTCPDVNIPKNISINRDIGLIVTFNSPSMYENIPLLISLYKLYFEHVLFCGPDIKEFRNYTQNITDNFIYIEALKNTWFYFYECTIYALMMNINVKGFIQIGDDTLLNFWNLDNLPRDRIWLNMGMRSGRVSQKKLDPHWDWWPILKKRALNVVHELISKKRYRLKSEVESRFLLNLKANTNNFTVLYFQGCDFMYVPMVLKDDYIKMSKMLMKHKVMVELAYPLMAMGLQSRKELYFVEDGSIWTGRTRYREIYHHNLIFLHPFKLKRELEKEEGLAFFCEVYLNYAVYVLISDGRQHRL